MTSRYLEISHLFLFQDHSRHFCFYNIVAVYVVLSSKFVTYTSV